MGRIPTPGLLVLALIIAGCEPTESECTMAPACQAGDTQVPSQADCLDDPAANCYQASACGQTIWCTGDVSLMCTAVPTCQEGETEVASESECLQDDAVCYQTTECSMTIWCTGPTGGACTAEPTCQQGETEVTSESECLQDDAVCYQATECGKSIWCTGPAPALTTVLGGGFSLGECDGACKGDLLLDGAAAQLVISGWAGEAYADNEGTLTEAGSAEAAAIAEALVGAELLETYGCPDCADGGAAWVILSRASEASTHHYEHGAPPEVLAAADAFVTGLINALGACTTTEHVEPGADCQVYATP